MTVILVKNITEYAQLLQFSYDNIIRTELDLVSEINAIDTSSFADEAMKSNVRLQLSALNELGETASEFKFKSNGKLIHSHDYFQKYTVSYLKGEEYFGQFFLPDEKYNLSHYHTYFNEELANTFCIMKGLEQAQILIAKNYSKKLEKWTQQLLPLETEIRTIRTTLEQARRDPLAQQIKLVDTLENSIIERLKIDTSKLRVTGASIDSDRDVAALHYLLKIIEFDTVGWYPLKPLILNFTGQALRDAIDSVNELGGPGSQHSEESILAITRDRLNLLRDVFKQVDFQEKKLAESLSPSDQNPWDKYEAIIAAQPSIDANVFSILDKALNHLNNASIKIKDLQPLEDSIQNNLLTLLQYAEVKKIESRRNTEKLLGLTEFVVHLLQSVQSKFDNYKQVNLPDTSRIQYTVIKADSTLTGTLINIDSTKVAQIRNATTWLSKSQFNALSEDEEARSIFLGLLLQQLQNLKYAREISSGNLPLFTTKVINSILDINDSQETLAVKKSKNEKITFDDRYPLLKSIVDLFSLALETPLSADSSLVTLHPDLNSFLEFISDGLSLYDNLSQKQYTAAIYNAMAIFKIISQPEQVGDEKQISKNNADQQKLLNKLVGYGAFISDVAKAETADEIKQALSSAATPAGSSRIKRSHIRNLDINSYLGMVGGTETRALPDLSKTDASIALSVPVGISFSWKFTKYKKGSWTAFAPILDIGAVTAFRFDDTQTSNLPDLTFQNFISPGLYLFRNINNTPFTFGAGWQYGPTVRQISGIGNQQARTHRWLISATIDVPIFNIASGEQVNGWVPPR
ncbi:MAG: hypothetical protein IPL46_01970 [Saprospiraceae bacterium]|nr:hypothetical protein [Saprospiraceae bacterium]